jgi:hypothetical protein
VCILIIRIYVVNRKQLVSILLKKTRFNHFLTLITRYVHGNAQRYIRCQFPNPIPMSCCSRRPLVRLLFVPFVDEPRSHHVGTVATLSIMDLRSRRFGTCSCFRPRQPVGTESGMPCSIEEQCHLATASAKISRSFLDGMLLRGCLTTRTVDRDIWCV